MAKVSIHQENTFINFMYLITYLQNIKKKFYMDKKLNGQNRHIYNQSGRH